MLCLQGEISNKNGFKAYKNVSWKTSLLINAMFVLKIWQLHALSKHHGSNSTSICYGCAKHTTTTCTRKIHLETHHGIPLHI
jgi:hypothetical protein